ncbi:hypothetical protein H5410_060307 [Solanum commersonii]|uniref:Uncharacterized protein n=1 Tax=Solanum commersonii TaxID=4109 RepID=A0A9J5W4R9_SOLCO|nr:hypothetical protein H5410_060307 [Solanum commersonii]
MVSTVAQTAIYPMDLVKSRLYKLMQVKVERIWCSCATWLWNNNSRALGATCVYPLQVTFASSKISISWCVILEGCSTFEVNQLMLRNDDDDENEILRRVFFFA